MNMLHMLYMLDCCISRTSSSVYLNLDRPDPHRKELLGMQIATSEYWNCNRVKFFRVF